MGFWGRVLGLAPRRRQERKGIAERVFAASRPKAIPKTATCQMIVSEICNEAFAASRSDWAGAIKDSRRWKALKEEPPEHQVAVMMAAADLTPRINFHLRGSAWNIRQLRKSIVAQTIRRNLPLSTGQLVELLEAWMRQSYSLEDFPGRAILGAVERHLQGARPTAELAATLSKLRGRALEQPHQTAPSAFGQGIADRIDRLLERQAKPGRKLPSGPFGVAASSGMAAESEDLRQSWLELVTLAAEAGGKSKPSGKWLSNAQIAIDRLDEAWLTARLADLLENTTPDPRRPDGSLDILKGLVWSSALMRQQEQVAGLIGRFAEKCFRKVPGIGPRSARLGNAALWALSAMASEPRAAAELFRLKEKLRTPSVRKRVSNRIDDLAAKAGESAEALEDASLPDFGLAPDGSATFRFGEARAEIRLQATALDVRWFNSAGSAVKTIPAEVRRDRAVALSALRQSAKEIEGARATQVLRLEQAWLEDRSWSYADWIRNFALHPLRRPIVEALIWCAEVAGDRIELIPSGGVPRDVNGQALSVGSEARVTLWHPLDSDPRQVLAWRQRILDLGVTQPIKQAHREVYVLTDAERRTEFYSNRFAAHILRQHQFRALGQARGWKYDLMGGWDGWNVPTRVLAEQSLRAEYQVQVVEDGQRSAAWVALHIASDQVRFVDLRGRPVPLAEIPPLIFSEVMRDVDLFVAVTSVANDPGWTDGGPNGHHAGYWREWAFGDLGQSATTRRELIRWLAPKLSIADRLEVTEKFLVVQGQRQKYGIHFGSSHIQILPSNRYLCIVPDGSPPEAKGIQLPFAGDNVLSIVLAKAFLLTDESKITDPTILSQL